MADSWTVVKVSGSLFDLPDLRERLSDWLRKLDADRVLLVPGGGAMADAIRELDRIHQIGEEVSHWLAIQALSINARFLQTLLPEAQLFATLANAQSGSHRLHVLDALSFFLADEQLPNHLPHCWEVTSDSLAVRAAALLGAKELILLKSAGWAGCSWPQAWHGGVLDDYFAHAMRQPPESLRVRVVNLRGWDFSPPTAGEEPEVRE